VALQNASKYLASQGRRVLAKYIVLATDGGPNCNEQLDANQCECLSPSGPNACSRSGDSRSCLDDIATVRTVANALAKDRIPTFVIGIGAQAEPLARRTLSSMAIAGGRPRPGSAAYYEATSPEALQEAFTAVQRGVSQCSYVTPSRPDDPNAISIQINGVSIPRSQLNGWDWIDQNYGSIAFFGAACDVLQGVGQSQVKGTVACKDANP
jgi:hypothetical protein